METLIRALLVATPLIYLRLIWINSLQSFQRPHLHIHTLHLPLVLRYAATALIHFNLLPRETLQWHLALIYLVLVERVLGTRGLSLVLLVFIRGILGLEIGLLVIWCLKLIVLEGSCGIRIGLRRILMKGDSVPRVIISEPWGWIGWLLFAQLVVCCSRLPSNINATLAEWRDQTTGDRALPCTLILILNLTGSIFE